MSDNFPTIFEIKATWRLIDKWSNQGIGPYHELRRWHADNRPHQVIVTKKHDVKKMRDWMEENILKDVSMYGRFMETNPRRGYSDPSYIGTRFCFDCPTDALYFKFKWC